MWLVEMFLHENCKFASTFQLFVLVDLQAIIANFELPFVAAIVPECTKYTHVYSSNCIAKNSFSTLFNLTLLQRLFPP